MTPMLRSNMQQCQAAPSPPDPDPSGTSMPSTCVTSNAASPPLAPKSRINRQGFPSAKENIITPLPENPASEMRSRMTEWHNVCMRIT